MAKPISFTKRDLEKKKQEKRLAKQQKKEDSRNHIGDMFYFNPNRM